MSESEKQAALYRSLMKHPMTSTTFEIEGHRVVKQLGVVRGITVRSRSVFGTIGASLQTLFGGNITLLHGALREDARRGVRHDGRRTPRRSARTR